MASTNKSSTNYCALPRSRTPYGDMATVLQAHRKFSFFCAQCLIYHVNYNIEDLLDFFVTSHSAHEYFPLVSAVWWDHRDLGQRQFPAKSGRFRALRSCFPRPSTLCWPWCMKTETRKQKGQKFSMGHSYIVYWVIYSVLNRTQRCCITSSRPQYIWCPIVPCL